jgi:hypothetical protein
LGVAAWIFSQPTANAIGGHCAGQRARLGEPRQPVRGAGRRRGVTAAAIMVGHPFHAECGLVPGLHRVGVRLLADRIDHRVRIIAIIIGGDDIRGEGRRRRAVGRDSRLMGGDGRIPGAAQRLGMGGVAGDHEGQHCEQGAARHAAA